MAYCEHPFRRLPNLLPEDGEPCAVCGQVYRRPAWVTDLSPQRVEEVRAFYEVLSLWVLVREGLISAQEANQERRRIARVVGWTGHTGISRPAR